MFDKRMKDKEKFRFDVVAAIEHQMDFVKPQQKQNPSNDVHKCQHSPSDFSSYLRLVEYFNRNRNIVCQIEKLNRATK